MYSTSSCVRVCACVWAAGSVKARAMMCAVSGRATCAKAVEQPRTKALVSVSAVSCIVYTARRRYELCG